MCIFLILGDVTLVLIEDLVFKLAIYRAGTSKRLFIFNFFYLKGYSNLLVSRIRFG